MNHSEVVRLNQLGDQLELLYKPLRLDPYNAPVNRDEEKAALFAAHAQGRPYNPQFTYNSTPDRWERPLAEFLRVELKHGNTAWDALLISDAEHTLKAVQATTTHDPNSITQHTLELHGDISLELIVAARNVLATTDIAREEKSVSAESAAAVLQEGLIKAGLTDWKVLVDPAMVAKMNVRSVEKEVRVRQGEFFASEDIQRLLVHEIGTHVFRAVNGEAQPLRLLRMGFAGYMTTEEGMATFHEEHYGLKSNKDRRTYALRVLAAHLSLTQGFFEVFTYISEFTSRDEAFAIVQRAKRGFTDTSVPGSHVKDKVYLEGFLEISDYLEKHPEHYRYLMSGKVSTSMIHLLEKLDVDGVLTPPRCLPEMLINQST
jgi:uncharacterized protein (TIGR02421 family)